MRETALQLQSKTTNSRPPATMPPITSPLTQPAFAARDEIQDRALHGLRGIALLYVLVSHIGNAGLTLIPIPHNAIGKVGVWIFFTLSAYLLTSRLCDHFKFTARSALGSYFIHRVARIYPLLLIVLSIHLLLGNIDIVQWIRHVLLMEGRGELWAISTEFQYYLVIPLIALVRTRLGKSTSLLLLASAAALSMLAYLKTPSAVFSNELLLFPKIAPFIAGSLYAIWSPPKTKALLIGSLAIIVLAICTVAYRAMSTGILPAASALFISPGIAIAGCALIHASTVPGPIRTLLSNTALVHIGKISFSIYLLHMFVIESLLMLQLSSPLAAWLAVAISIAISGLTFRWIETPFIDLGARIGRRLRAPAHRPGEPA